MQNSSRTSRRGEYRVSPTGQIRHCASCNAEIIWTTTVNQKRIPLSVATIRVDEQGQRFALSHFADYPNAKGHRKPAAIVASAPNVTPSDVTIDMRDYPATMQRLCLVAVSSSMDEAGRVTVTARPDTAQAMRDADDMEMW